MGAFIAAAGAIVQSGSSAYASHQQAQAAGAASAKASEIGDYNAFTINRAGNQAAEYAKRGQQQAMQQYGAAQRYAEAQRAGLGQYYDQARQVGGSALQQYQNAIMRGGLGNDAGYGFRASQGAQVGSQLGAPGMMQQGDWARFNQGLASTEYSRAMNRLQGLSTMGSQANAAYAGADMSALEAINRARGGYATEQLGGNQYLAQLGQNTAGAYANSLNNQASATSGYEIQRANALAQGASGVSNSVSNAAQNMMFLQMLNRQQQAKPEETAPYYQGQGEF